MEPPISRLSHLNCSSHINLSAQTPPHGSPFSPGSDILIMLPAPLNPSRFPLLRRFQLISFLSLLTSPAVLVTYPFSPCSIYPLTPHPPKQQVPAPLCSCSSWNSFDRPPPCATLSPASVPPLTVLLSDVPCPRLSPSLFLHNYLYLWLLAC